MRVVFGVNSSPFILNGTINHHFHKFASFALNFILNFLSELYVDNSVSGCNSFDEGVAFYHKAKDIMFKGGFQLKK